LIYIGLVGNITLIIGSYQSIDAITSNSKGYDKYNGLFVREAVGEAPVAGVIVL
jgi:hypothetical protein